MESWLEYCSCLNWIYRYLIIHHPGVEVSSPPSSPVCPLVFVTEVAWEEERTAQSSHHIPHLEKVALTTHHWLELHYTYYVTLYYGGPFNIIYLDMEMTMGISSFHKYVKTSIRYSRRAETIPQWKISDLLMLCEFFIFRLNTLTYIDRLRRVWII